MNVTKWVPGQAWGATFTVGDEGTNAVIVTIQLTDFAGNDLTVPNSVTAYLASDVAGLEIKASTVTTETAISSGTGSLAVLAAGQVYQLVSEADGDIAITISDNTADTYYVVVVLPNGKLAVSSVATFTA